MLAPFGSALSFTGGEQTVVKIMQVQALSRCEHYHACAQLGLHKLVGTCVVDKPWVCEIPDVG